MKINNPNNNNNNNGDDDFEVLICGPLNFVERTRQKKWTTILSRPFGFYMKDIGFNRNQVINYRLNCILILFKLYISNKLLIFQINEPIQAYLFVFIYVTYAGAIFF